MKKCEQFNFVVEKVRTHTQKSPWSCSAIYVNKQVEIERGVTRLVSNYKPLNQSLSWICYLIPNKKDLLNRLNDA